MSDENIRELRLILSDLISIVEHAGYASSFPGLKRAARLLDPPEVDQDATFAAKSILRTIISAKAGFLEFGVRDGTGEESANEVNRRLDRLRKRLVVIVGEI